MILNIAAVWTGIGIVGTVAFGMAFFHEPVQILRLVYLVCILVGIVGLRCIA